LLDFSDRPFLLPFGFREDNNVITEALVIDVRIMVKSPVEFPEIKFGQKRGERATGGDALAGTDWLCVMLDCG